MQKTLTMLAFMTMASIGAIAQPKLNKDNIEDVLNAMTLEEKASLLVGKSRFVIMNGVPTGTTSKVEGAAEKPEPSSDSEFLAQYFPTAPQEFA